MTATTDHPASMKRGERLATSAVSSATPAAASGGDTGETVKIAADESDGGVQSLQSLEEPIGVALAVGIGAKRPRDGGHVAGMGRQAQRPDAGPPAQPLGAARRARRTPEGWNEPAPKRRREAGVPGGG